jgi:hypothetical protein
MDNETVVPAGIDPDSKWILRTGAICAFTVVAGYLATFPLYAWVGIPQSAGIEAQLEYFGAHAGGWWAITWLMVVTDLLLLPLFLALYRALKGVGRDLMLLAIACIGLFVAVDLAVTWTAFSTLIVAGTEYAAATSLAARAASAARAAYPSAILESPLAGACAIVIPSLGILLAGLVMLRGVFNKPTAYLALATGVTAFAYMGSYVVEALSPLRIVNALLVTVWYALAGIQLYRLGQR